MEDVLRFKYEKGVRFIYPEHPMVKSWRFEDGQEAEATLCHAMAVVAEKNGMSSNDLQHLFPASLMMLKSDIDSAVVGQSEQFSLDELWKMAQRYNCDDFIKIAEEIQG